MDVFLSTIWFLLRIGLCIGTFMGVIWLFWRYSFGGYYRGDFGTQRWPIWSAPHEGTFRERPSIGRPPRNLAHRFQWDDDERKWHPTFFATLPVSITLIIAITLVWWGTGFIATLF